MKFLNNTSGFTLVEMVLATTIFAVMSIAVISIYLQTTALSSRLKATRYLSETAREITERIDEDVKER
jgi:prepilin-type N-terminal cleavage/methylation domain-containing protein